MYSLYAGIRRPLYKRILGTTFNVLAIAGWLVMIILIVSIIFGFFDDLLILSWEATE